jgi:hypothetical protein
MIFGMKKKPKHATTLWQKRFCTRHFFALGYSTQPGTKPTALPNTTPAINWVDGLIGPGGGGPIRESQF